MGNDRFSVSGITQTRNEVFSSFIRIRIKTFSNREGKKGGNNGHTPAQRYMETGERDPETEKKQKPLL